MKKPKINWSEWKTKANTFAGQYYKWCVVGVLLVILIGGWFGILQREFFAVQQNGVAGYEATIERLQDRQEYLAGLRKMEDSYNELNQEQLRQLEYLLPVGFDTTATIARMEQFAGQAGLQLLSVDVTSGQEIESGTNTTTQEGALTFSNKSIRRANIAMNLSTADGSYDELKHFLDTLDTFVPVLNLDAISYTPATGSYAIQVTTYYIEQSES